MFQWIKTSTAALCVVAVTAFGASAEDWKPAGPVKLMIAFAAGGGADTQARFIAEELEATLGWSFIPEQVTGKGGLNLAAAMKSEKNDGTVIGMAVTDTLGYNMAASNSGMTPSDFTPIVTTAGFQMGVVARSDKGWETLEDVIEAAKAGQDIRFGVMAPNLADMAYLLGKAQGVDFNIVSVQGGKAVMNGINAGDMDVGFMAGIQAKGVAAGELVNLASALPFPLTQTPDAPLLSEFGMNFTADGYFLIMGPAGMPDDARAALANAIKGVVENSETKAGGLIKKAFGGASVYTDSELDALVASGYASAGELLAAASE